MKAHYHYRMQRHEVLARLRVLTEYWDSHYGTRTSWHGFAGHISGKVLGIRFYGEVTIDEGVVHGELKKGQIGAKIGGRGYVLRKLETYLDPARSVDDLRALS